MDSLDLIVGKLIAIVLLSTGVITIPGSAPGVSDLHETQESVARGCESSDEGYCQVANSYRSLIRSLID